VLWSTHVTLWPSDARQLTETADVNVVDVLLHGQMSVEQNAKVKDNRRQIDGDIVDRQTAVVTGQFEHVGMEAEPPRQLCLC